MGGRLTFPGAGYYHATKHAVEALSDALRFEVQGFGVKVSIIEPGLIKTGFADAAVESMDGPQDGPYAGFDQAVARATAENYERGPISRLGGGPEAVAEAIERAISERNPRSRYAVTPSAHLFMRLRRLLPDMAWDAALRTTYPQPGR
jgi:NAD(P)-dependent dehydrogenase (short-subunit alcohol dehydrogenase family)